MHTRTLTWLTLVLVSASAVAVALTAASPEAGANGKREPIVIAHRGASGYRPEHTLAGYEHAIDHGADYIEPDLVSTKDGVLVARHENEIGGTTDVADASRVRRPADDEDRSTASSIDRLVHRGLHARRAEDAAREGADSGATPAERGFDGLFEVPTLQEVIDLAKSRGRRHLPRDQAPDLLRLDRPLARGAAGRDAEAATADRARRRRSTSSPSRSAT